METICAIATAPGGAIGIVRLSGDDAISLTEKILDRNLQEKVTYAHILDNGEILDEVIVTIFRQPHSYTGENTAEISCHGSPYILQRTMELLVAQGCKPARPGEFTQRAFLNHKMDLSRAEAVADLIAARSKAQQKMAMQQMRGNFSKSLSELRDQLLHITSLLELELDFSDHEDLEFADRSELIALAKMIEEKVSSLLNSFKLGNAIKHGVPVAIVGKTNAGKSTLLNALVGEERALVSDINGTTRDTIEDIVNIEGTLFRFIDTAGIRRTDDIVETMGIERTFQTIAKADIVLWVIDAQDSKDLLKELEQQMRQHCDSKKLICVFNKTDLQFPQFIPKGIDTVSISAKKNIGMDKLRDLLKVSTDIATAEDVIVSNIRHYEALCEARTSLEMAQSGLINHLSGEFVSQDLRACIQSLSEIVGDITSQSVLNNIFSHFCIGK
ncbi:tRNA uridine-5-carboxymethylaminomethyl(34) synthesis GTPase MnmE [Alloprevotella tannerae]|uniref:tRNA modification GTPase MnmE n=1 Tax=Alloprevotella tannerae TaxID=76122 RepID=A0A929RVP2_9BACT|nr:tRNA uridine-5-carboxymethylaminomethyl(34) synthesis GTPase MnmE [Alloprevotella tannerae]MBF0970115.1 tRNA uridine-5-carboxymethylaminomethyl(34) synthesis GTPase MnmE [Alloprevotella tannerae]